MHPSLQIVHTAQKVRTTLKRDFSPLDIALHLHSGVPNRVLPRSGRDHPANIPGDPIAREISSIHHDTRLAQRMGHCLHT